MNQSQHLTRSLSDAQETHANDRATVSPSVTFRVYTEFYPNLADLTSRYFAGFTLFFGDGVYEGNLESAGVIEIVATLDSLQSVVHLAGDIKHANAQESVLVTYAHNTTVLV